MVHELKIWPQDLDAILDGRKTFEIRRDDRGFEVGDRLRLREWDPEDEAYLEREHVVDVSYIADLEDGRVVLAIRSLPPGSAGPVS